MGKNNKKNKRNATAMAVGALMAVAGGVSPAEAVPAPSAEAHDVVTAADAVVIDGVTVEYGAQPVSASPERPKRKMYGPPPRPAKPPREVRVMYGPPVKPQPEERRDAIENYISDVGEMTVFFKLRDIFGLRVEGVSGMDPVGLYKTPLRNLSMTEGQASEVVEAINGGFSLADGGLDIGTVDFGGEETFGDLTKIVFGMTERLQRDATK